MHIISTGKSTILTNYPDLETRFIYQHANNEATDFQFFSQKRLFVEANSKSGLEFLRIKDVANQKIEVLRVRKIKIENLFCVACPKQSYDEVALGLFNGQIKLLNYTNSEVVYKFPAESSRNCVVYLDYNSSDEYISSVYENGKINIYGIKTRNKMETINIDNNSTLSRFHPSKRFHLAIASYRGSVHVYDIQAKRKLFSSVDCHASPCRDLCMSSATPDTLLSVGYDCVINIFDVRRKTQPQQIRNNSYPLSAVALSDCGTYFCVGNLKGELISYDMRNTKSILASKKIHENAVSRIAFVPNQGESSASSFSSSGNLTNVEATSVQDLRKSITNNVVEIPSKGHRDSFLDFLDFQAGKGQEKMSSRLISRRDSFDWDMLMKKDANSDDCRASILPRLSLGGNSSGNCLTSEQPVLHINSASADSLESKEIPQLNTSDFVNTNPRKKHDESSFAAPLKDRSNTSHNTDKKLKQIKEEDLPHNIVVPQACHDSSSDKENPPTDLELASRFLKLPDDRNSTPNRVERCSLENNVPGKTKTNKIKIPIDVNAAVMQIDSLRSEMNERFSQLEAEIKFNAESNKWHIFTQNTNLWNKHLESTEEIKDALGILLQADPFVNEYVRLKEENEALKARLQKLTQFK